MVTGSAASLRLVPFPPGLQLAGGRASMSAQRCPTISGTGVPPNLVPKPSAIPRPECAVNARALSAFSGPLRIVFHALGPSGAHAFFAMSDEFVRPRETGWAQRRNLARFTASSAPICERPAAGLRTVSVVLGGSSPDRLTAFLRSFAWRRRRDSSHGEGPMLRGGIARERSRQPPYMPNGTSRVLPLPSAPDLFATAAAEADRERPRRVPPRLRLPLSRVSTYRRPGGRARVGPTVPQW